MTVPDRRRDRSGPTWRPGRRLLVVGVGSSLRRDDALGPLVVAVLADDATHPVPAGVELRAVHGLTPELVVDVAAVDAVWFVDAAADPALAEPTWSCVRAGAAAAGTRSGHALDPTTLLALTSVLETDRRRGVLPEAWTLALPARDFAIGEGLSEVGRASLAAAVAGLRGRWRSGVDTVD